MLLCLLPPTPPPHPKCIGSPKLVIIQSLFFPVLLHHSPKRIHMFPGSVSLPCEGSPASKRSQNFFVCFSSTHDPRISPYSSLLPLEVKHKHCPYAFPLGSTEEGPPLKISRARLSNAQQNKMEANTLHWQCFMEEELATGRYQFCEPV